MGFSGVFKGPPLFPQDPILAELLHSFKDQIVGYHEHDSLLDHKEEEALSEEDRKAAWAEYEAEKKVSPLSLVYSGWLVWSTKGLGLMIKFISSLSYNVQL